MSRALFDDECQGCRPVLVNTTTQNVEPDNSPNMRAVNAIWKATSIEERAAFHRVTCLNSRAPADLALIDPIMLRVAAALEAIRKQARLKRDFLS